MFERRRGFDALQRRTAAGDGDRSAAGVGVMTTRWTLDRLTLNRRRRRRRRLKRRFPACAGLERLAQIGGETDLLDGWAVGFAEASKQLRVGHVPALITIPLQPRCHPPLDGDRIGSLAVDLAGRPAKHVAADRLGRRFVGLRDDKRRTAIVGENEDTNVDRLLDAIAGMAVDIDEVKPFLAVAAFTLFMPNRIVRLCIMRFNEAAAIRQVFRPPDPCVEAQIRITDRSLDQDALFVARQGKVASLGAEDTFRVANIQRLEIAWRVGLSPVASGHIRSRSFCE